MVDKPDTYATTTAGHGTGTGKNPYARIADLERQLAEARAERDRLEYERDVWRSKSGMHQKAAVGRTVAEAERDRLAAEVERLRDALRELCDWVEHDVGSELPFDASAALAMEDKP